MVTEILVLKKGPPSPEAPLSESYEVFLFRDRVPDFRKALLEVRDQCDDPRGEEREDDPHNR